MTDRRSELELELKWLDASDAFVAAKANREEEPEKYAKAKKVMSELRTELRLAGEAAGTRTPVSSIAVTTGDKGEE